MKGRDLYSILEVSPAATASEIKAAFRRLATIHHPDRNPNDPATARRFKRINSAFQVLSDPQQREAYDDLTRSVDEDPDAEEDGPTAVPANESSQDLCPRCNSLAFDGRACPNCSFKIDPATPRLRCVKCGHRGIVSVRGQKIGGHFFHATMIAISMAAMLVAIMCALAAKPAGEKLNRAREAIAEAQQAPARLSDDSPRVAVRLSSGEVGSMPRQLALDAYREGKVAPATASEYEISHAEYLQTLNAKLSDQYFACGALAAVGLVAVIIAIASFHAIRFRRRFWKQSAFCRECNAALGPLPSR